MDYRLKLEKLSEDILSTYQDENTKLYKVINCLIRILSTNTYFDWTSLALPTYLCYRAVSYMHHSKPSFNSHIIKPSTLWRVASMNMDEF